VRTDIPFARDFALSTDANQQYLTSAAETGSSSWIGRRWRLSETSSPTASSGPGHQIAVDSTGNIYIAQTTAGMQKLRRVN
jgi:hypothetical protein